MKEISTISLERMNNGAHFLYVSDILAHAEADTTVKQKTATQVAALKAAVEQEDEDLKLSQKSLLTDEIARADAERDSLYSGYKKAVQSFLNLPVEAMAQAAKVLNQHLKDYAISPQMQLDRETGMLLNLVTDLEGKFKAEVETLSLTPFVTNLKAANERVRTLTASRMEERMAVPVGALKTSRKASDEAYRALVKMVNALALVEGEADYAAFIDYVNAEITHYKREVLGQRTTTGGSGDKDDSGDTGEPGGGESPDPSL
ncbi:DUF6261 family protein [Bacteroides sp. AN502(2024)]|uniref:DUF6261 family protein n=1 Tax=Bacteroides sp. AN502(2024) TaxID=3160599 RepID=UPI00351263FF